MELDEEWDLSAEELESLERDALRTIAQRRNSSSSSCASSWTAPPNSSSYSNYLHHQQQQQQQQRQQQQYGYPPHDNSCGLSPAKPSTTTVESRTHNKVVAISPRSRTLPRSLATKLTDNSLKELPKFPVKLFLHANGNIAAKFSYDPQLVAALRKVPKATWNANERLWMFPVSSLSSAEEVLGEITAFVVEVENLDPLVRRAIAAASAIPDLRDRYERIPSYIESKLLPFQRDGVRFVLQHGGRVLLADEMGLGKTLQAIAVTACVRDSWPVLILAPSSLRLHWASMLQHWLKVPSSDILVVLSQWGGSNRGGFTIVPSNTKGTIHLDGVFNIISYDVVPKLQSILMASEFKVVIADESHFLKNAQAKRTSAALPVLQGVFGMYQGASNHEELHNLMKATVMIRRLKKDVLSELPVKRRQQVFLDLAEKDMKQVNALFRELDLVKSKIKACKSKEEVESLKFTKKNLINKIYTDSAEAKIPAVVDYLGTVIEAGCKFLIFAHHQPMIDAIYEFLLKKKVGCIRIDGSTPAASRQAMVMDFQEKDAIKAAVLSIKAGGVGLTLTAASTVIFAELSWTPGDMIQAEDRAHRIGQVSAVNIYYLLANDTVDDIIWDVVQSKLENLGQMLDGKENTLDVSDKQPRGSPTKQGTLDSFMKRCNSTNEAEHEPKLKYPRQ
ncbi:uncharacterized protein LOC131151656 isoform X6 [Malania oleifera]|uniref:uncharacterized protein LOC131151656 isoform X6 n=1 Tax=Malania oleifera TaxID=397392 RepID=UPI0025AE650B|nr:uncharacterized protein LOC131151656 isoform X6 [Malania oleifera]